VASPGSPPAPGSSRRGRASPSASWWAPRAGSAASFVKSLVNLDDVLDVTSLQAFPGAVGSILVGFFATSKSQPCDYPEFPGRECDHSGGDETTWGVFYGGDGELLAWQICAVVVMTAWAAVFTYITMKIIEAVTGQLNVSPEYEELGLDFSDHGEKAYDLDAEDDEQDESVKAAKLCNKAAIGDIDGCKALIKAGVDPRAGDVDGRTGLHIACNKGYLNIVQMFVTDHSVSPNVKDNAGNTPLKEATREGFADVIGFLKQSNAYMVHTKKEQARFLDAAHEGDSRTVEALLQAGADANTADYDQRTALHLAAASGNMQTVQIVLQFGGRADALDRFGQTPADDAKAEDMKTLISNAAAGAPVNPNGSAVSVLPNSDRAPDLDAADTSTSTREVLQAAQNGDLKDLRRLKKKGVKMAGVVDYDSRTALHLAAEHGHGPVITFLLKEKGDVNHADVDRQTPLHCALRKGSTDVVALLRSNGATITAGVHTGSALCEAAASGDMETVRMYATGKVDLSTGDYDQRTALHLAAANGNAAMILFLIANGANPQATDRWGANPGVDAKRSGHADVLAALGLAPVQKQAAAPAGQNKLTSV